MANPYIPAAYSLALRTEGAEKVCICICRVCSFCSLPHYFLYCWDALSTKDLKTKRPKTVFIKFPRKPTQCWFIADSLIRLK